MTVTTVHNIQKWRTICSTHRLKVFPKSWSSTRGLRLAAEPPKTGSPRRQAYPKSWGNQKGSTKGDPQNGTQYMVNGDIGFP